MRVQRFPLAIGLHHKSRAVRVARRRRPGVLEKLRAPHVQAWPQNLTLQALTAPCQHPVATAGAGEWWVPLEAVFHLD